MPDEDDCAFLRFGHAFRGGLHTYTATADSRLIDAVWRGLWDHAPYPDDPAVNPMDLFCIGNFAGERLAVWRAVAWAVTDGLHRCGVPRGARADATAGLGLDRETVRLMRWEYTVDVEDGDLGFVRARESVRRDPPPDRWELDHRRLAGLFPLASFDELTTLDGTVFAGNAAQVTVFGLGGGGRFDELAGALNGEERPVLADVLRPGELFVCLSTVRDPAWIGWRNTLTVRSLTETDAVERVAGRYRAAYRRYMDRLDGMRTLADFRDAAGDLLGGAGRGG